MIFECKKPVLILEGPGDREAVPLLIRRLLNEEHEVYDCNPVPNPIIRQNIPKLSGENELEKFIIHGSRRDCDSILVIIDADENCPKEISEEFVSRIIKLMTERNIEKKVGFCFFNCEYEVFFLHCLDIIAEKYPNYEWNLDDWDITNDHEEVRGAKGFITRCMKSGRSYKEIRDQARFTAALDFDRLRNNSRTFVHFESMLNWLIGNHDDDVPIYPLIAA